MLPENATNHHSIIEGWVDDLQFILSYHINKKERTNENEINQPWIAVIDAFLYIK